MRAEEKWKIIEEKAPPLPGVYIFKNSEGIPIYIGKSENLSERIKAYTRGDGRFFSSKIFLETEDAEFIITSTPSDALFLENSLIKKFKPPYNIRLKDDKSFLCIGLDLKSEWPSLKPVRKTSRRDDLLIFGPFSSAKFVREMLRYLQYIYPLRTCSDETLKRRKKPCLEYEMGRCAGPCAGLVTKKEYQEIVRKARRAIEKGDIRLEEELEKRMNAYAEQLRFEEAAKLRDVLFRIRNSSSRFFPLGTHLRGNVDVIAARRGDAYLDFSLLSWRGNVLTRAEFFSFPDWGAPLCEVAENFLKELYTKEIFVPERIIVNFDLQNRKEVENYLEKISQNKVEIKSPETEEEKRAMESAIQNAEYSSFSRNSFITVDERKVKEILGIPKISWVECFDISRYGKSVVVGSCVAMVNGEMRKDLYRRYRVRENISDDYSSMGEILKRRMERAKEEGYFPDLIVVDGGEGHLSVAKKIVGAFSKNPHLIAISKPGENEKAYDVIHTDKGRIELKGETGKYLRFLQLLRDEAHRFAISYLRKLDEKIKFSSELLKIIGIGEKKARDILLQVQSLENLKKMSLEELKKINGVGEKTAEKLWRFFRGS